LWEAGKACIIKGESLVETQQSLPELFQKEDIAQLYVYPVFVDRQLQSMFLFSKRRQPFNELDIKFIAIACQFFHAKVHQIRTEERIAKVIRQRNAYLAALHETTLGLVSRLDLNELLEDLGTRAGHLLGTPHGYIFLPEKTDGAVELENKVGVGIMSQIVGFRTKPGHGVAGMVWQSRQPLVVTDYDAWEHRSADFPDHLIRAIVGVPLFYNKRSSKLDAEACVHPETDLETGCCQEVVGVLGLAYDAESERVFGDEEVELLNRFADLATIVLDNARLYTEVQQAAEFIRQTFGRYVSEEVVASLLDSEEGLKLGGEKRKVTILMTDLRGFTMLSERLEPEQVVDFLNRYLEKMVNLILEYNGTVIEILGDGIMVIFGAPIQREDDAERAVACALGMQLAMEETNASNIRAGLPKVEMGIGIHTGEVVVGNIGSSKRTKYGVVGSDVNLTGRIESYTTGSQILISPTTQKEIAPLLSIDQQITVEPKGVVEPITIYDVKGIGGKHNLFLPDEEDQFTPLRAEISLQYAILEEKHIGRTVFKGSLVSLSKKGGVVRSESPAAPLSNIKIGLTHPNGKEIAGDLYAKVVEKSTDTETCFSVRFTSMSPEITAFLNEQMSNR
jgi:class 3 adenylate cyclase